MAATLTWNADMAHSGGANFTAKVYTLTGVLDQTVTLAEVGVTGIFTGAPTTLAAGLYFVKIFQLAVFIEAFDMSWNSNRVGTGHLGTAAETADAVWDEATVGHVAPGSFGGEVSTFDAANDEVDIGKVTGTAVTDITDFQSADFSAIVGVGFDVTKHSLVDIYQRASDAADLAAVGIEQFTNTTP